MTYQPGDTVRVIWLDAASAEGWEPIVHHLERHGEVIVSVGFVLRYDKTGVMLAQSLDADGGAADVLFVPKGMIRHVERLRKAGH